VVSTAWRPGRARGRHRLHLAVFCLCAFLASGCVGPVTAPGSIGAWLVYWDLERGLDELERHADLFDRVSLFAYELDAMGQPVPAPGAEPARARFLAVCRRAGVSPWATVVNDLRTGAAGVTPKDPAIVAMLLGEPGRRRSHASALATRAAADGFAGLDLDYEQLPPGLAPEMGLFLGELAAELGARGLGLNVVVQPSPGPWPALNPGRVTVMAYNEHGPHSGPGARATPRFVASTQARGRGDRASEPTVALALGGFVWTVQGEVRPLDWTGAAQLAQAAEALERNPVSAVPHLRLADGSEAWFEDPASLEAKWRAARGAGYRHLMLWRLGGNDDSLYDWIASLRSPGGSVRK